MNRLGYKTREGSLTAFWSDHSITYASNAKTWELYEEALHHGVQRGLYADEIRALTKELKQKFGMRRIRGGQAASAAEEIVVKSKLLLRLDLDEPTRVSLQSQLTKLRSNGLSGGY
jgi:hypothetical protein